MLDRVIPRYERAEEAGAAATPADDALRPIALGPEALRAVVSARRAEAWRFSCGVAIAVALHIGVLAIVAQSPSDERIGTAGHSLDAISVEVTLVPAVAAEALLAATLPEPAVSDVHASPTTTGSISPQKLDPPDRAVRHEPVEPAIVAAPPEPSPQDADAPVLPLAEVPPAKPDPTPATQPAAPATPVETVVAPSPGQTPSRGSAAPSPGAIQAFARSVAEALARTRPKSAPGSARGTVKIAFSVSDGGELEQVRVAQSSGRMDIDQAALAAVRRAAFPPPPKGLSLAQRTYEIPYHFR